MSQHTTKEILKMIADCAKEVGIGMEIDPMFNQFIMALRSKVASLPEEKVERKKPEEGEEYLYIKINFSGFEIEETTWVNSLMDKERWSSNRAYLMSERHLAAKKCEEINRIFNS